MLGELAIFLCLFGMLVAFWRRKDTLSHVKYGRVLLSAGFGILAFAAFVDFLIIGTVSLFDIGFSTDKWSEIWILVAFIPGMVAVLVGLVRILPAIGQLRDEVIARKKSERIQRQQNADLQIAKQRAERAEGSLIDAIESIPDAVIIFDAEDRIVTYNNTYRVLFSDIEDSLVPGIEFEALLRMQVEKGAVASAIGQEEKWVQERLYEHRHPDGPVEQEFSNGHVYRLSETKTQEGGIVSIRTDITPIRDREKALQENRAKLEEAQSVAHIGNWSYDSENKTYEWSDEIYRILGYEPGGVEPLLENYLCKIDPDDLERLRSTVTEARKQRAMYELEYRILPSPGKVIYVRELGRLNYDRHGNPAGIVGTMQDITAQHLIERELTQAKVRAEEGTRSKSLFLANMSHELRTPLNAVIGFSEVLAKEIFGPLENPKYREYADNIQSSGRHLLSLIDDLLDYSSLEAGTQDLRESEFNLFELAQSTRTMLAAKAFEKSTRFSISKDLNVRIIADERKMKQVLINLINNAIKFTPEKGEIALHVATHSNDHISIFIEDNGYGIDESEIEKIMQPFGRAQHSIAKSIEGTGLGLPLAKSIIELHGGELRIASNNNKNGTTVEIRLPKSRLQDCA